MVFQALMLYKWRSVARNVQLPLDIFKMARDERERWTADLLTLSGWQYVLKDPTGAAKIVYSYDTSGMMKLAHQIYMAKQVVKLINYGPVMTKGIGYMDPVAFNRTAQDLLVDKVIIGATWRL